MKYYLITLIILFILLIVVIISQTEHFSYAKYPTGYNSYNSLNDDITILRDINRNPKYYNITVEYTKVEINNILQQILNSQKKLLVPNKQLKKYPIKDIPLFIQIFFINQLNYYSKKSKYDIPNLPIKDFKIYKVIPLSYYHNSKYDRYQFYIHVYRPNKTHYFAIFLQVLFILDIQELIINKISLVGIIPEETLYFEEYTINKLNQIDPKTQKHLSMVDSKFIEKSEINSIVEKTNLDRAWPPFNICFPKMNSLTYNDCVSSNENNVIGVWDAKCTSNYQCPFYKLNTNYPNKRGGCLNGLCEMPVGVKRVGFTHYKGEPFCHNCNESNCRGVDCNRCCEKKRDYAFGNDFLERLKYKDTLNKKGLKVFGLNKI